MRLGVVADVHANRPALEAVLAALDGVDALVCAGDLVGYGARPNECVALLREAGAQSVMGNHDLMAIAGEEIAVDDALVTATMRFTRAALDEPTRAYLRDLPGERVVAGDVLVTHGTPGDPWHYVFTPGEAAARLGGVAQRIVLAGHTHRAMAAGADTGAADTGDHVALGDERWWLNPGSAGQSRERRARARALVLDLEAGEARFLALGYDIERARADLRAAGLPEEALHRRPRALRALAGRLLRARS